MYQSHRDIIGAWPSLCDFARDIGVSEGAVKLMRHRQSIAWYYWREVAKKAKRRKIKGVTPDVLKRLAPVKRSREGSSSTGCAA
jgi:hypothetical protein